MTGNTLSHFPTPSPTASTRAQLEAALADLSRAVQDVTAISFTVQHLQAQLLREQSEERRNQQTQGGRLAYRVAEIAEATGMSEDTIRRAIDRAELPAHRVGGVLVAMVADVVEWLERGELVRAERG